MSSTSNSSDNMGMDLTGVADQAGGQPQAKPAAKQQPKPTQNTQSSPKPPVQATEYGLAKYKGAWGKPQQLHLLRRTLFGVSPDDYKFFHGKNLDQSLTLLLTGEGKPSPPINNYNGNGYEDPEVPAGKTWVNASFGDNDGKADAFRYFSLKSWWIGCMLNQFRTINEKMVLFWVNHFGAQMYLMKDARMSFWYLDTIRTHALGNFKHLTKAITIDSGMLIYLNGNKNTSIAPNENFARELQELFTVGKGPNSHYTEDDVKAAARVLTGWEDEMTHTMPICFNEDRHDTEDKQFSKFYGNKIIKGRTGQEGTKETDELIDMIFYHREASMHFCRVLYRWFVNDQINEKTEKNVISPMADIFIANNFELQPVLMALFASEHFYDPQLMGSQIKNPVDHLIGVCRQFGLKEMDMLRADQKYGVWKELREKLVTLNMDPGDPPNVAGWPAYYQEPGYYKLWINSNTLPLRNAATDFLLSDGTMGGIKLDMIGFTKKMTDPSNPTQLIEDTLSLLSTYPFDEKEKAFLLNILLSGQKSIYYWTDAWLKYINDPNEVNASVVTGRLSKYYSYLTQRAEYQLM